MKRKIADGEARERLIIWIRRRMAEFGITVDALAEVIQHDIDHPPLYRDVYGNEWNGEGAMPGWLSAACSAGVNPDFFRISEAQRAPASRQEIDPRQLDLFRL
jgi:DNA-binding protein H-NS